MREHVKVIEFESDGGYRFWTRPMLESETVAVIRREWELDYVVSDYCCAFDCWCVKERDNG